MTAVLVWKFEGKSLKDQTHFFDLNEKFAQQQLKIPIGKALPSELLTFDIEVLTLLGCRFYSP